MLMCIQNLVKFCPLVLKILSGNENYDGITELQINRQGKSSIAPTFSKRGYNEMIMDTNKIMIYKKSDYFVCIDFAICDPCILMRVCMTCA